MAMGRPDEELPPETLAELERMAAELPPLTPEQLDELADTLALIRRGATS